MDNIRTADAIRPKSFDDIVGQDHLFGKGGVVRRMIEAGRLPNMIFYGPPGTGKTTAAEIIAKGADMVFHRVNATTATLSDVKDILQSTNNVFCAGGILLYIDEIQYFNKKQQQALLEYIEDGRRPWLYRNGGKSVVPFDKYMPYPRLCAHRGLSSILPENTMVSFGAAIALGASEIEFDLWVTTDGELVSCHDDTTCPEDNRNYADFHAHSLTHAHLPSL